MTRRYGQVELVLDHQAIGSIIGQMALNASYEAAASFIDKAKLGILKLGRVQTGKMLDGFELIVGGGQLTPEIVIFNYADYTIYQEMGTKGSVARKGSALRFSIGGRIVFAKRTGPIASGNFMRNAIAELRLTDFGVY